MVCLYVVFYNDTSQSSKLCFRNMMLKSLFYVLELHILVVGYCTSMTIRLNGVYLNNWTRKEKRGSCLKSFFEINAVLSCSWTQNDAIWLVRFQNLSRTQLSTEWISKKFYKHGPISVSFFKCFPRLKCDVRSRMMVVSERLFSSRRLSWTGKWLYMVY